MAFPVQFGINLYSYVFQKSQTVRAADTLVQINPKLH